MTLYVCEYCGGKFTEYEMAETIEEFLCDRCASGIDDSWEDDGDDWGDVCE